MFSEKEIDKVLNNPEVLKAYDTYKELAIKSPNRIPNPIKLKNWVMNIAMGESGGFSLTKLTLGVIEAAIYTYSHTLEDHIRIANEDSLRRLQEKNLPPELKNKIIENNKKLSSFSPGELTRPKQRDTDGTSPHPSSMEWELNLEQKFALKAFESQVEQMSREQAQNLLKQMYQHLLIKDKVYKTLIQNKLGL